MTDNATNWPACNPWALAVDDALVATGLDCTTPESDPRASVAALIEMRETIALDPRVSAAAQALIERGRADGRRNPPPYITAIAPPWYRTRWWLRSRPFYDVTPGAPRQGQELYAPWWSLPFEGLHRLTYGAHNPIAPLPDIDDDTWTADRELRELYAAIFRDGGELYATLRAHPSFDTSCAGALPAQLSEALDEINALHATSTGEIEIAALHEARRARDAGLDKAREIAGRFTRDEDAVEIDELIAILSGTEPPAAQEDKTK